MAKVHKITSYFCDMRKFLSPKFWSLGTPLGSLGPGSQADLDQRACRPQILFIWGPCKALVLVALLGQAKILKTAGAWCDLKSSHGETIFSVQRYTDDFDQSFTA